MIKSLKVTMIVYDAPVKTRVPLGRPGYVADIAAAFYFLAYSESDYMTGLAISITGGEIMH